MTINEVLMRQNFITKLRLKSGDSELSKDLKIKVMAMRIEYAKVRKQFDEDMQEFVNGMSTDEFKALQQKEDKTEEEKKQLQEMLDKFNSDYQAYAVQHGQDEVTVTKKSFTTDEYNEILDVNSDVEVDINGQKLSTADFLEILYTLFVEE